MEALEKREKPVFEFFKYLKFLIKRCASAGVATSPTPEKVRLDSWGYGRQEGFTISFHESLVTMQKLLAVTEVEQEFAH